MLNVRMVAFGMQPQFPGLFVKILSNGKSWIISILGAFMAIIPDFIYANVTFLYYPSMSERAIKNVQKKKNSH